MTAAPGAGAITVEGVTREAFLVRAVLAAGAACGALSAAPLITRALAQETGGDVAILNFALTLERLEAEFYTRAAKRARGLSRSDQRLVRELRDHELEHVDALAATIRQLGGVTARTPRFAFGGAFADRAAFLRTANLLEDTGVSAYNGAAPQIRSPELLATVGAIVQVEARHAALIRLARDRPPAPRAFDTASEMATVRAAIRRFG